jgi:hypothetical protein
MTDDHVRAVLDGMREERNLSAALLPLSCPNGLALERARALALAPKKRSTREHDHLAQCPHCRRVLATFTEEAFHPERSALLRWAAGWSPEGEAETLAIRAHLVEDGCERCAAVCAEFRSVYRRSGTRLAGATRLPRPEAAVASERRGPYRVASPVGAGPLRWCLHQDGPRLVLDVASTEQALLPALVRYAFTAPGGQVVGFLPLSGPDREGHCTAHATLDAAQLHELSPDGSCDLELAPILIETITESEKERLPESIRRAPEAEWRAWVERQPEKARPALRALILSRGEAAL